MRARGGKKKEDMWAGWKEVWLECDGCGMFVCARVRGLGVYMCGVYLTRRMAKVE